MSMEMIVERSNLNLKNIYRLAESMDESIPFYLGDEAENKKAKYDEIRNTIKNLTKKEFLEKYHNKDKNDNEFLDSISDEDFVEYIGHIDKAIGKFDIGDSHLHIDLVNLQNTKEVAYSVSSYNLLDIFKNCSEDGKNNDGDYVIELDKDKVKDVFKIWENKRRKLILGKWIWYFNPNIGNRILEDVLDDLGISDYLDFRDMEFYYRFIKDVNKEIKEHPDDRFWLIISI